jgi:hypothetical protein
MLSMLYRHSQYSSKHHFNGGFLASIAQGYGLYKMAKHLIM